VNWFSKTQPGLKNGGLYGLKNGGLNFDLKNGAVFTPGVNGSKS